MQFTRLLVASLAVSTVAPVGGVGLAARSPVEKLVDLLKGLSKRINEDGDAEEKTYDKYACWCDTMAAKKATAITEARDELRRLGTEILERRAEVATLSSEISQLVADAKDNEDAQAEAVTIRQKENAIFMATAAEMKQAIAALEKANTVLGKATSFVQDGVTAREEAIHNIRAAVAALPDQVVGAMSPSKLALVRKFATAEAGKSGYTPQSATIQGILEEMYNNLSSDLETNTKAEAKANRDFEGLIKTKQEALAAIQEDMSKKEKEKAEADAALAEATEMYDDTESQMKHDVDFFDTMKESCESKSDEWKERKGLRSEEMEGIAKAIEILTSDEARGMFDKAIGSNAGFLQVASSSSSSPAQKAYMVIKDKASKSHSLRLARLAAEVRAAEGGHFDKVIGSIDEMVQTLKDEESDDIKKRDQCKEQFHEIESTVEDLNWKIEKNKAKIAKLEDLIKKREDEKTQTIEHIADVEKNIKDMENMRKEENEAFVQAKKDDEDAIDLLNQAKAAFTAYNENNDISLSLAQAKKDEPIFEVSEETAPEATFSDKGSRKGEAKGVVGLFETLVENLDTEIANGEKAEEKAQAMFEKALEEAKDLKETLIDKKATLTETIANHNSDKDDEHGSMTDNIKDKGSELDYKKSILDDCQFAINAYGKRHKARTIEIDALVQAKAFLSGYQKEAAAESQLPGALVQSPTRLRQAIRVM